MEKHNDENRKKIKQIIDDIVFNAFKKDETALKIAENSWRDTASDYWESTKAFFKHPTTQGVVAGAAIGATAALVAPAANMLTAVPGISHIPGVGQAISGVATLGSAGPIVGIATGAAAGYMFPKIAAVFKPFKYLYNEVKDIITKPKSYFDRAFRGGAILTSTVGMAVGIGFLVAAAANPFSGPVIGGIIVGAFATALVAAGTAKAASFISKKISKHRYGVEDIDLYTPTEEAKNILGGAENAQKVSDYFKKEISALQEKFDNYPDQETISGIKLGDQLDYLKSTWSKLQKGDSSNWEYLSRVLYKEKMEGCKTTVEQINTSDITNTLLELVTAPKSAKPDDLSPAKIVAGPERKSLSFSKHKEAVAEFDTGMKDLRDVNAIIMAAKNK